MYILPSSRETAGRSACAVLALILVLAPALAGTPAWADLPNIDEIKKGVVRIFNIQIGGNSVSLSTGSGFVINRQGYIITNHHVIARNPGTRMTLKVMTQEISTRLQPQVEKRFAARAVRIPVDSLFSEIFQFALPHLVDARVVWSDPADDIAILQANALSGIVPLTFSKIDFAKLGQDVFALGYPGTGDRIGVTSMFKLKATPGSIKSKEYSNRTNTGVYEITAAIHQGNSGGPLVNSCGEVLGINSFRHSKDMIEISYYAVNIDEVFRQLRGSSIPHSLASSPCASVAVVGTSVDSAVEAKVDRIAEETDEKVNQIAEETDEKVNRIAEETDEKVNQIAEETDEKIEKIVDQMGKKDPVMIVSVIGSLLLGLVAVILASTKQGRAATRSAFTHIGQTISRSPPPPPPPPQPVLEGIAGDYAGYTLELDENPLVIGRDPRVSQLVFPPTADKVSKRHCILTYDADKDEFILEDCWSTNGTYLDSDERVDAQKPRRLAPGNRFYLSDRSIAFAVEIKPKR